MAHNGNERMSSVTHDLNSIRIFFFSDFEASKRHDFVVIETENFFFLLSIKMLVTNYFYSGNGRKATLVLIYFLSYAIA